MTHSRCGWALLVAALGISCAPTVGAPVHAVVETRPTKAGGDTDDMAIWRHPDDPSRSLIFASDKKNDVIITFDLSGKELRSVPGGKMGNIDLREGVTLKGKRGAVVVANDRTDHTMVVYRVDEAGVLERVAALPTKPVVSYGSCLYRSKKTGELHAFVTSKDGTVGQYRVVTKDGELDGTMVRTVKLGSKSEGCVADDELGQVYISEETRGIWRLGAEPEAGKERCLAAVADGTRLQADVEGLALYRKDASTGYLIASSQGSNHYAVYRRERGHAYVGSFRVVDGDAIDGTSKTDGIEVTAAALGASFPRGMFVAHDGENSGEGGGINLKLVSWATIESTFSAPGPAPATTSPDRCRD